MDGGFAGQQLLVSVWRFRLWVLTATVLAAALGWGASQLQPVVYEATAEMLLADPRNAGVFGEISPRSIDSSRYLRNQVERLQSSTVAAKSAEQLGDDLSVADVRERISATASGEADLITVTAGGGTADEAAALANAVVAAYQEVVAEEMRAFRDRSIAELEEAQQEIQGRIDAAQTVLETEPGNEFAERERDAAVTQLVANQQLIERITVDAALYGTGVELVEPAAPPEDPARPQTTLNTILAALLGLGGATVVAALRASTARRADHRHDPAEVLGVPLLGAVPDLGRLSGSADHCPTVVDPDASAAEAYRFVAAALEHALGERMRTVVVTSALADEGKTTVSANLAVALKQAGLPALLVDTDARQQGLTGLASTEGRPGLSDLGPESAVEDVVQHWGEGWGYAPLTLPGIVPVGTRMIDPAQYFRTTRYRAAIQRLREHEYLAIVDAPPLLAVSDASAIAGSADGIVLVVNRGTPLKALNSLQERLAFVGTPVLGYVFNRVAGKDRGYGYGYGSGVRRSDGPSAERRGELAAPGAIQSDDSSSSRAWDGSRPHAHESPPLPSGGSEGRQAGGGGERR